MLVNVPLCGVPSTGVTKVELVNNSALVTCFVVPPWTIGKTSVVAAEVATGRAEIAMVAMLVALTSQQLDSVSEQMGSLLASFALLRFLNPTDVLVVVLAAVGALVLAVFGLFRGRSLRGLLVVFCVVSLVPAARSVVTSATAETPPERQSRPEAFFGPQDIEAVGSWIREKTEFGTLFATNYLCGPDRLEECTRVTPQTQCPVQEPTLMAGWALSALSRREFYYLSQAWELRTNYHFVHELSTRLSSDVSEDAVRALQLQQIEYFVAAKNHTDPQTWSILRSNADFATANFAVVSLATLLERAQK